MAGNHICQCCGMPLSDEIMSRNPDGTVNEEYCKYCYSNGKFTYTSMEQLIDFCVKNVKTDQFTPEQMRVFMKETLPKLNYWKNKS